MQFANSRRSSIRGENGKKFRRRSSVRISLSSVRHTLPRLLATLSGCLRRMSTTVAVTETAYHGDVSGARSVPQYTSFVLSVVAVQFVVMGGVPAWLFYRSASCRGLGGCFSLERDLLASINHSVHPCDDFYGHVCGRWNSRKTGYRGPPARKYQMHFRALTIWSLLQRDIPKWPKKALDKSSAMLVHCAKKSSSESSGSLREFLLEVGLSWPVKGRSTRQQLLESLVTLSLDFGMPALWNIVAGRHLLVPTQNTLYMSLDSRFHEWSADVQLLGRKGNLLKYLRRCAEVVGGKGESYSGMITDVLTTHVQLAKIVKNFWTTYKPPEYMRLYDPELRRAINGRLPDDSQLWVTDEVVDLQPGIFEALDKGHLTVDGKRDSFKQFLGMYLVWALSPFVSESLHKDMLNDMGVKGSDGIRKFTICYRSVSEVMPLVSWKVQADMLGDNELLARHVFHLAERSIVKVLGTYNDSLALETALITSHLRFNAMNMSMTWPMLDRIYAFVPVESTQGSYFDRYRRAARAAAALYKASLRRPRQNVYHMTGVATEAVYRLLVTREVYVDSSFLAPPLVQRDHPVAVPLATLGSLVASRILPLLRLVFEFDNHFQQYAGSELLGPLLNDMEKFDALLNSTTEGGPALDLRQSERDDLRTWSLAVAAGATALIHNKMEPSFVRWPGPSTTFKGILPDRLFFLVACFMECGRRGRSHRLKKIVCNLALPSVPQFRKAFLCTDEHRLTTNFAWREAGAA